MNEILHYLSTLTIGWAFRYDLILWQVEMEIGFNWFYLIAFVVCCMVLNPYIDKAIEYLVYKVFAKHS